MNNKFLVKLSNLIGSISIILLVYWVFTFILIEIFGLKVFRENLTSTFYLSILGILALMLGALIINIMFNMTRIAQKHNADVEQNFVNKKIIWTLLAIFPLIAILLFSGDYFTSVRKKNMLIQSADSVVKLNENISDQLLNYQFDENYIQQTKKNLELLSATDKNFPSIAVIVKDSIDDSPVFLGFKKDYYYLPKDSVLRKVDYIRKTTEDERKYLHSVFDGNNFGIRYSSYNGNYELFYPYLKGNKKIIFYLSDYQNYGKVGS